MAENQKKKLKRDSPKYRLEERRLLQDYCPPIQPCGECGWPVVSGYCCTHCGNADGR